MKIKINKNIKILYLILIILVNYNLNSQYLDGYYILDYEHKGGTFSNDTIVIYGDQGQFIYSLNNGANWQQSFIGAYTQFLDCEIYRNELIFINNFGLLKGKVIDNKMKTFNINNLPSNSKVIKLFNENNKRLICLTSNGEVIILDDIYTQNNEVYKVKDNSFINPKIFYSEPYYLILDSNSLFYSTNLKDWKENKIDIITKNEFLDYEKINEINYIITKNEVLKLDATFNLISKIDSERELSGIMNYNEQVLLVNNLPFINDKDTLFLSSINEKNQIITSNHFLDINKFLLINNYKINTLIKLKNEILLVGPKKLVISLKNDNFVIKSIMPFELNRNFGAGISLKFVSEEKGIIKSINNQLFTTIDGGATWSKFGNFGKTSVVNAVFEIKEDTILYYLPNFKENDILISNDFGKTFNSFGIDFIGTGAKKIDFTGDGFYICDYRGDVFGTFMSIVKYNMNATLDSTFGNINSKQPGITQLDSISSLLLQTLNKDSIYILAFDLSYKGNFKINLYNLTNNGKDINIVGNPNIDISNFKILKDKSFISSQLVYSDINKFIENIYKSTDFGETWKLTYSGEAQDNSRYTNAVFEEDVDTIYFVNQIKILKSTNKGETWVRENFKNYIYSTNGFSSKNNIKYLITGSPSNTVLNKSIKTDFVSSVEIIENNIEDINYLYTMPPFPNPSTNTITTKIYWDSSIDINLENIGIYDIMGNKIIANDNIRLEKLNNYSGNLIWDTSNQPKGTYLLKIQHGNNTKSVKVVVN